MFIVIYLSELGSILCYQQIVEKRKKHVVICHREKPKLQLIVIGESQLPLLLHIAISVYKETDGCLASIRTC